MATYNLPEINMQPVAPLLRSRKGPCGGGLHITRAAHVLGGHIRLALPGGDLWHNLWGPGFWSGGNLGWRLALRTIWSSWGAAMGWHAVAVCGPQPCHSWTALVYLANWFPFNVCHSLDLSVSVSAPASLVQHSTQWLVSSRWKSWCLFSNRLPIWA